MLKMKNLPHPLIKAEDSVLIVIDVQDLFINKLSSEQQYPLLDHISWLIGVANWLMIPLIVTAEDIGQLGPVHSDIKQMLPPETPIYNKMTFGLADEPDIIEALRQRDKGTCVLVGLETDVCIAHSALGLLELGYKVCVVSEATGSPGMGHLNGLERIREAGGLVISVKGLFYEWLRNVEAAHRFRQECKDLEQPKGLRL